MLKLGIPKPDRGYPKTCSVSGGLTVSKPEGAPELFPPATVKQHLPSPSLFSFFPPFGKSHPRHLSVTQMETPRNSATPDPSVSEGLRQGSPPDLLSQHLIPPWPFLQEREKQFVERDPKAASSLVQVIRKQDLITEKEASQCAQTLTSGQFPGVPCLRTHTERCHTCLLSWAGTF